MIVENGADPAANDIATTVADDTATQQTDAAENTEAEETEGEEGGEGEEQDDPDDIEIDVDGTKIKIARKVKEAIAKPFHQDYTRKTEELSQQRAAHAAEREGWNKTATAIRDDEITVAAIEKQLTEYKKVDWNTLFQTNQEHYHQHIFARDQLKEQLSEANSALSQKKVEFQAQTNREAGERLSKAQAEIARHLPEWTPGGELDTKLFKYVTTDLKITNAKALGEASVLVPELVRELNRLRLYDEAAKKQKTTQTFQKTQEAKPVTQVGGNSGTALRRTTDSSGDKLSTEEWAKRETERVAKQRQAMGRR